MALLHLVFYFVLAVAVLAHSDILVDVAEVIHAKSDGQVGRSLLQRVYGGRKVPIHQYTWVKEFDNCPKDYCCGGDMQCYKAYNPYDKSTIYQCMRGQDRCYASKQNNQWWECDKPVQCGGSGGSSSGGSSNGGYVKEFDNCPKDYCCGGDMQCYKAYNPDHQSTVYQCMKGKDRCYASKQHNKWWECEKPVQCQKWGDYRGYSRVESDAQYDSHFRG